MLFLFLIPKRYRLLLKKRNASLIHLLNLLFSFIVFCFIYITLFKFYEKTDWLEAVWQIWQTATTVGYGNRPAQTTFGIIISMIFGTVAIGYLPVIMGYFIDLLINLRARRRFGFMKNKEKNGYIIFNYPGFNKFNNFITEIRNKENDIPFCLVDSSLEELPKEIYFLDNIHFIHGGLLEKDTYLKANVKEAKTIIIFPKEDGLPDSDGTTQTIVKLLEKFINVEKTRIIHVLVDEKHEWLFSELNSTSVLDNIGLMAVVQECQDKYSAKIIEKIVSNINAENSQTIIPKKIVGMTWGELSKKVIIKNININLLALIKNGNPIICPSNNEIIAKNDLISIIAKNDYDWNSIEKFLLD